MLVVLPARRRNLTKEQYKLAQASAIPEQEEVRGCQSNHPAFPKHMDLLLHTQATILLVMSFNLQLDVVLR